MTIKSAAAPGRTGGYTLIELLATLCVASIVVSWAVPSLDALMLDGRRTAVINELLHTLLLARSETAKRGSRPLIICGVSDADGDGRLAPAELRCSGHDWSEGWMIGTWEDRDGNATVSADEFEALRVFQTGAAGRFTLRAGNFAASPPVAPAGTLLFKAFGRRTSNGTITFCDRRGPEAARAVIVNYFGRARASATRADGTPLRCP